jgi:hypothetical protein
VNDVLTWEEIERRYPDEWVLLDELQPDGGSEVTGGRIVFHSRERDETDQQALSLKLPEFAVLFTGEPDPDLAFLF